MRRNDERAQNTITHLSWTFSANSVIFSAGELARTYGLPQTLAVYDSILEDVKRCDWEQVESAIKEASASNSRGCVSVNFYRTILKNRRIPRSHLKDL